MRCCVWELVGVVVERAAHTFGASICVFTQLAAMRLCPTLALLFDGRTVPAMTTGVRPEPSLWVVWVLCWGVFGASAAGSHAHDPRSSPERWCSPHDGGYADGRWVPQPWDWDQDPFSNTSGRAFLLHGMPPASHLPPDGTHTRAWARDTWAARNARNATIADCRQGGAAKADWRWQPHTCSIPPVTPAPGMRLLLIGDSLVEQLENVLRTTTDIQYEFVKLLFLTHYTEVGKRRHPGLAHYAAPRAIYSFNTAHVHPWIVHVATSFKPTHVIVGTCFNHWVSLPELQPTLDWWALMQQSIVTTIWYLNRIGVPQLWYSPIASHHSVPWYSQQWRSGVHACPATSPVFNGTALGIHRQDAFMNASRALSDSVKALGQPPVFVLNTSLAWYRADAHLGTVKRHRHTVGDCLHSCLRTVPFHAAKIVLWVLHTAFPDKQRQEEGVPESEPEVPQSPPLPRGR